VPVAKTVSVAGGGTIGAPTSACKRLPIAVPAIWNGGLVVLAIFDSIARTAYVPGWIEQRLALPSQRANFAMQSNALSPIEQPLSSYGTRHRYVPEAERLSAIVPSVLPSASRSESATLPRGAFVLCHDMLNAFPPVTMPPAAGAVSSMLGAGAGAGADVVAASGEKGVAHWYPVRQPFAS